MSYVKPELVLSPRGRVSDLNILFDGGENSWSLAKMNWDEDPAIAIRWNGGSEDPKHPAIGTPHSRGIPTWFILPDEVGKLVADMKKSDPRAED